MSLSARVLIGLLLGVAVGLFLGEEAAPLGVLGDAFVLLLQMTVLPFVVVSLVHGLGCIRPEQARSLALRAGAFVLLFVALSVLLVLLFPLAFPNWPSASFFSRQLVEPPSALDLVALYIPANPFTALAESTVPAVVIFSTALGVAVMRARRKQALLDTLSTLLEALIRIAGYVGGFAPYGVFALVAQAAGTMDVGSFQGLQLYLLAFSLLCTVLALWWIPILVTALAPLSYRELVLRTRGALLTAFGTASSSASRWPSLRMSSPVESRPR